MKQLGVFLLPLDGLLVRRRSLFRDLLGFSNNILVEIYTCLLGWELSVLFLASARTRIAHSGVEHISHEATWHLLNISEYTKIYRNWSVILGSEPYAYHRSARYLMILFPCVSYTAPQVRVVQSLCTRVFLPFWMLYKLNFLVSALQI